MNYKLYKETIPELSALQQVLYNRGIPVEEQKEWCNAGWKNISNWDAFMYDRESVSRMVYGVNMLYGAIESGVNVVLIADSDVDGFTSSAIITNYLYTLYPDWTHTHLKHILHEGKEHGLADVMDKIPNDTALVIVPDAGSNDIEQHKILAEKGIDILVLDFS